MRSDSGSGSGDATPPSVRVLGVRGRFLELAVSDGGSGVDPVSLQAQIDEDFVPVSYRAGRARVPARRVLRADGTR